MVQPLTLYCTRSFLKMGVRGICTCISVCICVYIFIYVFHTTPWKLQIIHQTPRMTDTCTRAGAKLMSSITRLYLPYEQLTNLFLEHPTFTLSAKRSPKAPNAPPERQKTCTNNRFPPSAKSTPSAKRPPFVINAISQ